MDFFEQMEARHYGSMELKRHVGPNMLRGFLISVLAHIVLVAVPYIILINLAPAEPKRTATVRVVDISQLTPIKPEPDIPRLEPLGGTGGGGGGGGGGRAGREPSVTPPIFRARLAAIPYEVAMGTEEIEPRPGLIDPFLRLPSLGFQPEHGIPVPTDLPDIASSSSGDATGILSPSLPVPQSAGGQTVRGTGASDLPDLDLSTLPSGSGIGSNGTDLPPGGPGEGWTGGRGLGEGTGYGGGKGSGLGTGEGSGIGPGRGSGTGGGEGSGIGPGRGPGYGEGTGGRMAVSSPTPVKQAVDADELSGLLAWLRGQRAGFPEVVKSYMETQSGDLCGITNHMGWDVLIQFAPAQHQLKIFLSRGTTGILLADSDFRQRSQLFALGTVTRSGGGVVTAVEAMREKPSLERTNEFYQVFGDWMMQNGIRMGSRAAR
jgi:hypothetical protein